MPPWQAPLVTLPRLVAAQSRSTRTVRIPRCRCLRTASPRGVPLKRFYSNSEQRPEVQPQSHSTQPKSPIHPQPPNQPQPQLQAHPHSHPSTRSNPSSHRSFQSPSTLHALRSHLFTAQIRALASPHIAKYSDHAQRLITRLAQRVATLSLKLNEVTGYHEVERLKAMVTEQETALESARFAARAAKDAYDEAVTHRSNAQRDVNSLLERKHSWTDHDVIQFTSLVRTDHASTAAVHTTSSVLKEREVAVDKAFSDLTNAILRRYHEEQVWSDKIRSVSTWANVVGLIVNFLIFVIAIAIVEPWKRKRLVERVEERMTSLIERLEGEIEVLSGRLRSTHGDKETVSGKEVLAAGTDFDFRPEPDVDTSSPFIPDSQTSPIFNSALLSSALPTSQPSFLTPLRPDDTWPKVQHAFDKVVAVPYHENIISGLGGAAIGAAIVSLVTALLRS